MFDTSLFADPKTLFLGAITGIVFGFLLQKGGVTKFHVIVGQFLLRDNTVLKVMLTAIVVGGIGVYGMLDSGMLDELHVKSTQMLANVAGGLLFGVGMAILGYCPGTAIAAIGDRARDAVWGVVGMLAGAAIYVEAHPWLSRRLLDVGALGKETLATVSGVSPWLFLVGLAMVSLGVFLVLERHERSLWRSR